MGSSSSIPPDFGSSRRPENLWPRALPRDVFPSPLPAVAAAIGASNTAAARGLHGKEESGRHFLASSGGFEARSEPDPAEGSIPLAVPRGGCELAKRLCTEAGVDHPGSRDVLSSVKSGTWESSHVGGGIALEDARLTALEAEANSSANDDVDGFGAYVAARAAGYSPPDAPVAETSRALSTVEASRSLRTGRLCSSMAVSTSSSEEANGGARVWVSALTLPSAPGARAPISAPIPLRLTAKAPTTLVLAMVTAAPAVSTATAIANVVADLTTNDGRIASSIADLTTNGGGFTPPILGGLTPGGGALPRIETRTLSRAPVTLAYGAEAETLVVPPAPPGPLPEEAQRPSALIPVPSSSAAPAHYFLRAGSPVFGTGFSPAATAAVAATANIAGSHHSSEPTVRSPWAMCSASLPCELALHRPSPDAPGSGGVLDSATTVRTAASLGAPSLLGFEADGVQGYAAGITSVVRTMRKKRVGDAGGPNTRRNRTRPTCTTETCKRRPLFGVEGTRRGKYCSIHREPGMVNVLCRRCEAEKCKRQPSFGMIGSRPMRCAAHRLEGMVNVLAPRCRSPGCHICPSFGRPGEKKASVCAAHRRQGDVDLVTRRCHHEGCVRRPVFGNAREGKAYYCASHKLEGMINVFAGRCAIAPCARLPTWGPHGFQKPTHCGQHREPQHVNRR